MLARDRCINTRDGRISVDEIITVEPVLKDYPIGHKNVVFQDMQVVSGDRFNYIEI